MEEFENLQKKHNLTFWEFDKTHFTLTKNERGTWDEYFDYKIVFHILKDGKISIDVIGNLNKEPVLKLFEDFFTNSNQSPQQICLWFMNNYTPLHISNAQSASPSPLITAPEGGVLNVQRCKYI